MNGSKSWSKECELNLFVIHKQIKIVPRSDNNTFPEAIFSLKKIKIYELFINLQLNKTGSENEKTTPAFHYIRVCTKAVSCATAGPATH